jgi:hypothetical protein
LPLEARNGDVLIAIMAQERTPTPGASSIDMCPDCGKPFVVPTTLLDVIDEGLYLVVLHCRNCDRLAVGITEDAEMEEVELAWDRAEAQMAAFAEILELAQFIEDIDHFTRALRADMVLPEDF